MRRRPQPITAFNTKAPVMETLNQEMIREKLLALSLSLSLLWKLKQVADQSFR